MSEAITQWEYDEEIERIAREALDGERDHGQDARDAAWETVDGHQWIIYTSFAMQIPSLAASDGADFLDGQDLNATYREGGLNGLATLIAFACMYMDVNDEICELREATEDAAEE